MVKIVAMSRRDFAKAGHSLLSTQTPTLYGEDGQAALAAVWLTGHAFRDLFLPPRNSVDLRGNIGEMVHKPLGYA
jgi:hypothetical protein